MKNKFEINIPGQLLLQMKEAEDKALEKDNKSETQKAGLAWGKETIEKAWNWVSRGFISSLWVRQSRPLK